MIQYKEEGYQIINLIKRAELADNLVTETKYLKLNNFFSTKTHSLWEVNGFSEKDKPFNYLAQKYVLIVNPVG